jgi:hypothetical protein
MANTVHELIVLRLAAANPLNLTTSHELKDLTLHQSKLTAAS